jgi:hypothetical protein
VPEVLVRRHVAAGEVDVQAAEPADEPAQATRRLVVRSQVGIGAKQSHTLG